MVSASGLLISSFLGALARRIQVQIVGKSYPRSWDRVPGYVYCTGAFIGGYLTLDHFIDRNRVLLNRRLEVLREQRAQDDVFHELDPNSDSRYTARSRTSYFRSLWERYGQPYK